MDDYAHDQLLSEFFGEANQSITLGSGQALPAPVGDALPTPMHGIHLEQPQALTSEALMQLHTNYAPPPALQQPMAPSSSWGMAQPSAIAVNAALYASYRNPEQLTGVPGRYGGPGVPLGNPGAFPGNAGPSWMNSTNTAGSVKSGANTPMEGGGGGRILPIPPLPTQVQSFEAAQRTFSGILPSAGAQGAPSGYGQMPGPGPNPSPPTLPVGSPASSTAAALNALNLQGRSSTPTTASPPLSGSPLGLSQGPMPGQGLGPVASLMGMNNYTLPLLGASQNTMQMAALQLALQTKIAAAVQQQQQQGGSMPQQQGSLQQQQQQQNILQQEQPSSSGTRHTGGAGSPVGIPFNPLGRHLLGGGTGSNPLATQLGLLATAAAGLGTSPGDTAGGVGGNPLFPDGTTPGGTPRGVSPGDRLLQHGNNLVLHSERDKLFVAQQHDMEMQRSHRQQMQNKQAQARYRERQKAKVAEMERTIHDLQHQLQHKAMVQEENAVLRQQVAALQGQLHVKVNMIQQLQQGVSEANTSATSDVAAAAAAAAQPRPGSPTPSNEKAGSAGPEPSTGCSAVKVPLTLLDCQADAKEAVQKLQHYMEAHNLLTGPIVALGASQGRQMKRLVDETFTKYAQVRHLSIAGSQDLLRISLKAINSSQFAKERHMWAKLIASLELDDWQIQNMMALRSTYMHKLQQLYEERHAATGKVVAHLLPPHPRLPLVADGNSNDLSMADEEDEELQHQLVQQLQALSLNGYVFSSQNVGMARVVGQIRENLHAEQEHIADANRTMLLCILNTVQAGRFAVGAWGDSGLQQQSGASVLGLHIDCMALYNAVSLLRATGGADQGDSKPQAGAKPQVPGPRPLQLGLPPHFKPSPQTSDAGPIAPAHNSSALDVKMHTPATSAGTMPSAVPLQGAPGSGLGPRSVSPEPLKRRRDLGDMEAEGPGAHEDGNRDTGGVEGVRSGYVSPLPSSPRSPRLQSNSSINKFFRVSPEPGM